MYDDRKARPQGNVSHRHLWRYDDPEVSSEGDRTGLDGPQNVDAKDDKVVSFYRRYDFIRFADQPKRLFIPMAKIEKLFQSKPE
jgi:hypothetical protein